MSGIAEALAAVMADVSHVGKGERNQAQNFSFRGIDAVLNAVGPALRKHSVIVLPQLLDIEQHTVEVGRNRTLMGHATVTVRYRFVAPDGTSLDAVTPGEAMDSGDKAVSKAMSVAFRTALIQALALPTDEPDPDSTVYERSDAPAPVRTVARAKNDLLRLCGDKAKAQALWDAGPCAGLKADAEVSDMDWAELEAAAGSAE